MASESASRDSVFNLEGRVAVITGGGGLLGKRHARALAGAGAIPVLLDLREDSARAGLTASGAPEGQGMALAVNITSEDEVNGALKRVLDRFGRVDILVNNAANNPAVQKDQTVQFSRLENFPLSQWADDFNVGVTGAFLCSRAFGGWMAEKGKGTILNIASDLAVIAPDQRIYRREGLAPSEQPVKPVTYSVVKSALIGLTRYLATYWADRGVRCNALSPGGVFTDQPSDFVARLTNLIPMGRMANVDEYEGAVLFLCSDASSYMTGQNLIVDGGRTCW